MKQASDRYFKWIWVVSVTIPLVVAILLYMPSKLALEGDWIKALPHFNALLNTTTALLLISAVVAIKQKHIKIHKALMSAAFTLGALFLVSYVVYHAASESVMYGDTDGNGILSDFEKEEVINSRVFYLLVLLSHILLAIIVVPFVLIAFFYALTDQIEKHKKIVKFTFPIWLYVSVTGVVVYLMISPYY